MSYSEKQVGILRVMSHVDDVGSTASVLCRNSSDPGFPNPPGGIVRAPETNTSTCSKVHCDSPTENNCVREWKNRLPVHLTASLA